MVAKTVFPGITDEVILKKWLPTFPRPQKVPGALIPTLRESQV